LPGIYVHFAAGGFRDGAGQEGAMRMLRVLRGGSVVMVGGEGQEGWRGG